MKKVKSFGQVEENALKQAENCLLDAEEFILMADNHKGYGMPVGGVAVYKDVICPAGVGFDIACGNKAIKLDIKIDEIDREKIADQIWETISFGIGQKNNTTVEHDLFNDPLWEHEFFKERKGLKQKAQNQLGTIGSGNHYVDVFYDEDDYVWVGVHFGSRGLGHAIASHYMQVAGDNPNIIDERPHTLRVESREGQDYMDLMQLAGRYAYAGRDWVCETVAGIIGGEIIDEVHNHHNFAWEESHGGEKYFVVRKGATPAFPGVRGFVGSNMEDQSVIIEGIDTEKSRDAFYSTIHGAGRVMSRTEAAGRKKIRKAYVCGQRDCDGLTPFRQFKQNEEKPKCPKCGSKTNKRKYWEQVKEGKIDYEETKKRLKKKDIALRGGGADESPEAYKKLEEVLKHHEGTIKITHRLTPVIVCMAGYDIYDPYKD